MPDIVNNIAGNFKINYKYGDNQGKRIKIK